MFHTRPSRPPRQHPGDLPESPGRGIHPVPRLVTNTASTLLFNAPFGGAQQRDGLRQHVQIGSTATTSRPRSTSRVGQPSVPAPRSSTRAAAAAVKVDGFRWIRGAPALVGADREPNDRDMSRRVRSPPTRAFISQSQCLADFRPRPPVFTRLSVRNRPTLAATRAQPGSRSAEALLQAQRVEPVEAMPPPPPVPRRAEPWRPALRPRPTSWLLSAR